MVNYNSMLRSCQKSASVRHQVEGCRACERVHLPNLEAGNIAYKIAQRLGGFEAYGPILQGLNKPVSDLSRGANEQDVYQIAIITVIQSLANESK